MTRSSLHLSPVKTSTRSSSLALNQLRAVVFLADNMAVQSVGCTGRKLTLLGRCSTTSRQADSMLDGRKWRLLELEKTSIRFFPTVPSSSFTQYYLGPHQRQWIRKRQKACSVPNFFRQRATERRILFAVVALRNDCGHNTRHLVG